MVGYLQFNGSTGRISFANATAINLSNTRWSFSFAIYIDSSQSAGTIFEKYGTDLHLGYECYISDDSIILHLIGDTERTVTITSVPRDQWVIITFTYDYLSHVVKGYINTTEAVSSSGSVIGNLNLTSASLIIGCTYNESSTSYTSYFKGLLDRFCVYKDYTGVEGVLTTDEIAEICALGRRSDYVVLSTGKRASFALNCDSLNDDGKLVDAVGGLLGTLVGGVEIVTENVSTTQESWESWGDW